MCNRNRDNQPAKPPDQLGTPPSVTTELSRESSSEPEPLGSLKRLLARLLGSLRNPSVFLRGPVPLAFSPGNNHPA
jgi:hypothetical protein